MSSRCQRHTPPSSSANLPTRHSSSLHPPSSVHSLPNNSTNQNAPPILHQAHAPCGLVPCLLRYCPRHERGRHRRAPIWAGPAVSSFPSHPVAPHLGVSLLSCAVVELAELPRSSDGATRSSASWLGRCITARRRKKGCSCVFERAQNYVRNGGHRHNLNRQPFSLFFTPMRPGRCACRARAATSQPHRQKHQCADQIPPFGAISDAFQKREKANEDYTIRLREREKLLELKKKLNEQQAHLKQLEAHMYVKLPSQDSTTCSLYFTHPPLLRTGMPSGLLIFFCFCAQ